ncbi:hypothetical protein PECL_531 [Pediococcus claussenii ATCC BAA-344]|uniref:Uncharacterized protein n=1 Tax=Pediococcus claussenii (strain ATCC BAA-344 / DSM 14800 / JCM 18046 / KCTC 3811 / LMG 21948 / P06) TaxID=701521 RepID=G8PC13_PEDCP|nr:hypothetical protein PECL_531 [Pediococcus claussenii ATCC BAA-344]
MVIGNDIICRIGLMLAFNIANTKLAASAIQMLDTRKAPDC